jgi:hypothetical protein
MSVVFDVQGPGHSVNWKLSFRFRLPGRVPRVCSVLDSSHPSKSCTHAEDKLCSIFRLRHSFLVIHVF